MAQNQVYLIKSGENSFVEETQAIVGISGGKVGIGTTHPEADLHVTGNAQVDGNLTVKGNLTTIDETTIQVDDKNIELGVGSTNDAAADGGGITLHGTTNKTFNWADSTDAWTSSENLHIADGKHFAGDELRALDAGGLNLFDANQSGITIKGGKVGVHKTAPAYDLDVDGSGNFTSLYVGGNSVLTGEGSIFGKWEDGATAGEIFYTGGNVGVGTTNPEHDLHVVGNGVVDGNFVVNGTSGTFNVSEFDVSGSNITLNSAGGGLDSSRGGLIVNAGGNKTFQYVDGSNFWQSSEDIQIVADKHLQTDTVRAIDADGLYLQDDGGNGIHIQDGGQVNIAGITKADGGLNVGNGKFKVSFNGSVGDREPDNNDVIKWDGSEWIAGTAPGGGGSASSEVPLALSKFLDAGESIHAINFDDAPVGGYDNIPSVATDLEIVGEGSIIPYAISGLSNTGYYAIFSQDIPTENTYKLHTTFGGREVYWRTGEGGTSIYYDGDDVSVDNLTVGGNLTVNGTQTIINTETVEIEDHNLVIAANTGYNQLTSEYPGAGDAYAGILWGTGDAGAASPVSLTYQSNKGFAFEGGNVGVGTTNPSAKLHIKTATLGQEAIIIENSLGNQTAHIGHLTDGSSYFKLAEEDGTNHCLIRDNGDSYFVAGSGGGNVGIGTTSPGAKLHVKGSGNVATKIESTSSSIAFTNYKNPDHDYQVGMLGNGDFYWYLDSVYKMYITSSGNVGIGTTNPRVKLTSRGTSGLPSNTGNDQPHGLFRVENAKNQVLDFGVDEDGPAWMQATASDGLGWTTDLTINPNGGNVGIGTTSPFAHLDIQSSGRLPLQLYRDTTTTIDDILQVRSDVGGTSSLKFYVEADGDVVSATNSFTSDERAKTEISDLSYGLDKINQLKPKQFKMLHSEEKGFKYGFVAQDIEDILPDLVRQNGLEDGKGGYYKALEYNSMIAILTKAIQEQQQLIDDLKSQNESLAARISALES